MLAVRYLRWLSIAGAAALVVALVLLSTAAQDQHGAICGSTIHWLFGAHTYGGEVSVAQRAVTDGACRSSAISHSLAAAVAALLGVGLVAVRVVLRRDRGAHGRPVDRADTFA